MEFWSLNHFLIPSYCRGSFKFAGGNNSWNRVDSLDQRANVLLLFGENYHPAKKESNYLGWISFFDPPRWPNNCLFKNTVIIDRKRVVLKPIKNLSVSPVNVNPDLAVPLRRG